MKYYSNILLLETLVAHSSGSWQFLVKKKKKKLKSLITDLYLNIQIYVPITTWQVCLLLSLAAVLGSIWEMKLGVSNEKWSELMSDCCSAMSQCFIIAGDTFNHILTFQLDYGMLLLYSLSNLTRVAFSSCYTIWKAIILAKVPSHIGAISTEC